MKLLWCSAFILTWTAFSAPVVAQPRTRILPFRTGGEFLGQQAYLWAEVQSLEESGQNLFGFWPPVDDGMRDWLAARTSRTMLLRCPGSLSVLQASGGAGGLLGTTPEFLQRVTEDMRALTNRWGNRVWWNAMPEFDQAGGDWTPGGRPRYLGLTRRQAYQRWLDHYRSMQPLGEYLRQSANERGFHLAAVCDYAPSAHYAYQMGVELVLLERMIDELGDIGTGIAFLRGAAKQFGKPWGIDLSMWHTAADSATTFDDAGQLIGGWSVSYFRRHWYLAYMSGADVIHNEPVVYSTAAGGLNPLGRAVQEVCTFAHRHPDADRGLAVVGTAIMLDCFHGFDTKHGLHNQSNAVWYQDIPYQDGDYMLNNLLQMIYPGHQAFGTLPADAPQTADEYRQALLAGRDPRPWERMGASRWGDQFDVLLNNAPSSVLSQYQTIVLCGGEIRLTPTLKAKLRDWCQAGGTLVTNINQVSDQDQEFLGVTITANERSANASRWKADGETHEEPEYRCRVVQPTSAAVWAETPTDGAPLITCNSLGIGKVILTTPYGLQDRTRSHMLLIGHKLIDTLVSSQLPIKLIGSHPIQFVIGRASGKTIVTLANHSTNEWTGTILARVPKDPPVQVMSWNPTDDTPVRFMRSTGFVTIPANVAPFDVRIYAIETSVDRNKRSQIPRQNRADHSRSVLSVVDAVAQRASNDD